VRPAESRGKHSRRHFVNHVLRLTLTEYHGFAGEHKVLPTLPTGSQRALAIVAGIIGQHLKTTGESLVRSPNAYGVGGLLLRGSCEVNSRNHGLENFGSSLYPYGKYGRHVGTRTPDLYRVKVH
jgi:hypothetical protein